MILNNVLDNIFVNSANIAVLRALNERVAGISGRETARLAGIGLRSAQIALDNLVNLKVVNKQAGGREHLFSLNRKNYISNEIIAKLFVTEQKYKKSVLNEITNSLSPLTDSVILFGSVARKEELPDSDMDICIVFKKNKSKIEKIVNALRDELYDKYGVTLAPFYITRKEFKKRAENQKSPVNEILTDGIIISGIKTKELLNG